MNIVEILEVDGRPLVDLDKYEIHTPLFQITWPEDNLPGLPPGPDSLVTVGTFIILAPLPKGQHIIHRHVEASDGWMTDVTWVLTVE